MRSAKSGFVIGCVFSSFLVHPIGQPGRAKKAPSMQAKPQAGFIARLLPAHQVVFEHQAPRIDIEVANTSTEEINLSPAFGKLGCLIPSKEKVQPRDSVRGYTAVIKGGEPARFLFPETEEGILQLKPREVKRFSIATDPIWEWTKGHYYVAADFRECIGSVRVSVVKQPLFITRKLPREVRDFFEELYSRPFIKGESRHVHAVGPSSNLTWRMLARERPYLELSEEGKELCRRFRRQIIEVLKENIGNYTIRPELFCLAAELESEELVPHLIDLLTEYTDNAFIFPSRYALNMLGTLDRMLEKLKGGQSPQIFQILRGFPIGSQRWVLWWAPLRGLLGM